MERSPRLLSGPDIAAGFILQLTEEPGSDGPGHTFHLQEAGTDADAEAPASPSELGFAHPRTACMFGGPRCWEKLYVGGGSDGNVVRFSYNRFRFVLGAQLAQRARRLPVPVEEGLRELLTRAAPRLSSPGVAWSLEGSVSGWIRGAPETPRCLRLRTNGEGASILQEALAEYRIEPRSARSLGGAERCLETVAFVGTFARGLRVAWREEDAEAPGGAPPADAEVEMIPWDQWKVPARPAEFEFARLVDRGRYEEARAYATWLSARGTDPRKLRIAVERSARPVVVRQLSEKFLGAALGGATGGSTS